MTSQEHVVVPKPAPKLNVPSSTATVSVRVINTTSVGKANAQIILQPHIDGHDTLEFPCLSFLITNDKGNKILFDLGIRKDFKTGLPPVVAKRVTGDDSMFEITVEKNVADILDADEGKLGITSKDIDAVVLSHHHWDHVGDITTFPASTELVVGPGFKDQYLPGYPTNPDAPLLDADFEGRTVREIALASFSLTIGRSPAYDYFGDGSFYLLSTPGHTIGHMCGLARVTPDTFVYLGGDCAHHGGEIRPTEYLPLPTHIAPATRTRHGGGGCPGAFMEQHVHPFKSATRPFYDIAKDFSHDHEEAGRSINSLQEFDASDDVLMCIAHDMTLIGTVDFYPDTLDDWKAKGYKEQVMWSFCGDFKVDQAKAAL